MWPFTCKHGKKRKKGPFTTGSKREKKSLFVSRLLPAGLSRGGRGDALCSIPAKKGRRGEEKRFSFFSSPISSIAEFGSGGGEHCL